MIIKDVVLQYFYLGYVYKMVLYGNATQKEDSRRLQNLMHGREWVLIFGKGNFLVTIKHVDVLPTKYVNEFHNLKQGEINTWLRVCHL